MKYEYMKESEQMLQYFQFPKFLLKLRISQTAKFLYMILYDRARISRKNSWIDKYGNVYLIFPIEELSVQIDKCKSSVKTALKELDDVGLLVRRSGGFSKPNHLYVKIPSDEIGLQLVDNKAVEVYLKEEFGAGGFVYNPSKNDASWLDKCRNIASEMDGVLKQYRMYVEDGQIDRELLEMSSEHIVLSMVPSFLENKYAYAESTDIHHQMHLLFSDQSTITYTEKTKSSYNSFCLLIMSEEMRRSDFFEYQLPAIDWLIEKNVVYVDDNEVLRLNRKYIVILADMYKHDVVCVQYYGKYKTILTEMKDSNDIRMESTLFSVPETNYLNYMLNRSEYSNGKDLKNNYIHSTYPMEEDVQMQDYMDLLKIMITIIGKVNEEFLLRS